MTAAMRGASTAQTALTGSLVSTAMETGPPLGLAVLTWAATTRSHVPAVGGPFVLRAAAILLFALALGTMTHRSEEEHQ